ncbi:MAG: ribonuclease E/G [Lachnospiraceae bacterium]|nr:ribonuclease E/G [Lachnospiraceae bacterium]
MGKLVITRQKNRLLLVLFDDKKPYLMETATLPGNETLLGNIYLARVKDIVPGIGGAFLAISNDQTAYMPLNQKEILVTSRVCENGYLEQENVLRQEDKIVVQITGEALKTKPPSASANLTLAGQYCVCSFFGHGIQFSKKLNVEKKQQINENIQNAALEGRKKYQFTIRTNAENLDDFSPLLQEMKSFIEIFNSISNTYQHRTCYTCFYHQEPEIISLIKNIAISAYDEIVTDEDEVFKLLKETYPDGNLRFYQDDMISLSKLYSIETHLKEALGKRVWLNCGGYLVIEPTEAMVVIDVNSGKAESKRKKNRDFILKINLEAAKEVARQLRIRNYSGMIMVDFINMDHPEDNQKLLRCLDAYLKEDQTRTRLVDMTALGIVEITRKKISKPLSDFF